MSDEWTPTSMAGEEDRRAGHDCLRCGAVTRDEGVWTVRTGGSSGGMTALFGALAEMSEDVVDLSVRACPACGHVEFRLPPRD